MPTVATENTGPFLFPFAIPVVCWSHGSIGFLQFRARFGTASKQSPKGALSSASLQRRRLWRRDRRRAHRLPLRLYILFVSQLSSRLRFNIVLIPRAHVRQIIYLAMVVRIMLLLSGSV